MSRIECTGVPHAQLPNIIYLICIMPFQQDVNLPACPSFYPPLTLWVSCVSCSTYLRLFRSLLLAVYIMFL